jgi:uncharacterized membrane protein
VNAKKVRAVWILTLVLISGCADYNSNSADKQSYGPITLDASDPRFAAAYAVLKNRCINCHNHSAWSAYTSDDAWVGQSRAVVKNNASASPMIQQIQVGAMPQDGTIPPSETQILTDWINQMP